MFEKAINFKNVISCKLLVALYELNKDDRHTILGAGGGTVISRFTILTVSQVVIANACCYSTRGAGRGLITSLRTVVTDGTLSIGWVW